MGALLKVQVFQSWRDLLDDAKEHLDYAGRCDRDNLVEQLRQRRGAIRTAIDTLERALESMPSSICMRCGLAVPMYWKFCDECKAENARDEQEALETGADRCPPRE